VIEVKKKQKY